jgi:hypothetical protein
LNKSLAFLKTKARCLDFVCLFCGSHCGAAERSGLRECDAM